MAQKNYKIEYTFSSRDDMRNMKKYILDTFQYRELGNNFTKKMKGAAQELKAFPTALSTINLQYKGYDIHLKPYQTYLFFYIVDEVNATVTVLRVLQDGMNWQFILKKWLRENDKAGNGK